MNKYLLKQHDFSYKAKAIFTMNTSTKVSSFLLLFALSIINIYPNHHHDELKINSFSTTPSWLASMIKPILGYTPSSACLYESKPSKTISNINTIENIMNLHQLRVNSGSTPKNAPTNLSTRELGINIFPYAYDEISTNRSNFGEFRAISAITNQGKVTCILLISNVKSWTLIGCEFYALDHPFVKEFVEAESEASLKKVQRYVQCTRCRKPCHTEKYGNNFGLRALKNMAKHNISPIQILDTIYNKNKTLRNIDSSKAYSNNGILLRKNNISVTYKPNGNYIVFADIDGDQFKK